MNDKSSDTGVTDSFRQALKAHQSGQFEAAEAMYRQVLAEQPENADACHLLGLSVLQQDRLHEARDLIEAAIGIDDGQAPFHGNLAEVYLALDDIEAADRCYRAALEREPGFVPALTNLGVILHQRGQYPEAVARFEEALDIGGPTPDGLSNLGMAQLALGALDEAIATLRKSIDMDPHQVEANNNLGAALLERGEIGDAAFVLEEAVRVDPRCADAWCNLARARWSQFEFEAAEQHVRRALELAPDQAKFHYVLGLVLRDAHRLDEAEAAFGRSLQLDPYQAVTRYGLGALFIRVGRFTEAESELRRAVDLQPQMMVAYEALSRVRRFDSTDLPEIERLEQFAGQLDPQVPGRADLEFALAKMLDDCQQYDRAFGHLRAANGLKRAEVVFDPQEPLRMLEDTRRIVTGGLIEEKARFGSDSDVPILVVGMPRSGTTLVEQILVSHPEVSGAGEIGYLGAAARSLARQTGIPYPSMLAGLGETASRDLADGYLQRLEQDRNGARHVTDKGMRNFEHLGLVSMLFPKARIVHCVRNPIDICFSIYCQSFAWENQFAYDLEEIAAYYRFYQAMMDHWHAVLPGRIHALRYEDLVENQERATRGLLQHCGLIWDERCLRPHETEREIRTASDWQVRQPVYAGSVARWRNYERYLGPLVEALGDCAATQE